MSEAADLHDVGGVLLPQPFKIGRLGHLGLYLEDPLASSRFYGDVMGMRRTDVLQPAGKPAPIGYFHSHNTDHHAMAFISADLGRTRDPRYGRTVTVNQLSFQVGSLEEVVNAHRWFNGKGHDIFRMGRDRPGSNWALYFKDPDGHMLELFYGMEQIGWDGRSKPMQAFAHLSRLTAPELPQPSELDEVVEVERQGIDLHDGHLARDSLDGAYVVGGVRLPRPFKVVGHGPVVLFVADVDVSTRFYQEQLGLQLTETTQVHGHRAVFLRAGSEHHTIGLVPLAARPALGLPEHTTLASFGIRVGSYTQLRDAVRYLQQQGCQQLSLPAELHPGIEYAAHFMGPEGHCLQLYFDMERIGWDGQPRPAHTRRTPQQPWPEQLHALSDSYADRSFMGPLG
jgi:catechol-2,3-dioxygenase